MSSAIPCQTVNVQEAAFVIGLSSDEVRRRLASGELTLKTLSSVKRGRTRIPLAALCKWAGQDDYLNLPIYAPQQQSFMLDEVTALLGMGITGTMGMLMSHGLSGITFERHELEVLFTGSLRVWPNDTVFKLKQHLDELTAGLIEGKPMPEPVRFAEATPVEPTPGLNDFEQVKAMLNALGVLLDKADERSEERDGTTHIALQDLAAYWNKAIGIPENERSLAARLADMRQLGRDTQALVQQTKNGVGHIENSVAGLRGALNDLKSVPELVTELRGLMAMAQKERTAEAGSERAATRIAQDAGRMISALEAAIERAEGKGTELTERGVEVRNLTTALTSKLDKHDHDEYERGRHTHAILNELATRYSNQYSAIDGLTHRVKDLEQSLASKHANLAAALEARCEAMSQEQQRQGQMLSGMAEQMAALLQLMR